MSRKIVLYVLFFIVLVACFFWGLGYMIPGFFRQHMPPISKVEPFAFTTQEGKTFTDKDAIGKIRTVPPEGNVVETARALGISMGALNEV